MHAKKFVMSTQELTHTPYLLIFTTCKKSRFGLKRGKKAHCNAFQTGAKIYLSEKMFWG